MHNKTGIAHKSWVAAIQRILLACPTFTQSGEDLQEAIADYNDPDLQDLGRFAGEQMNNLLNSGDVHDSGTT